MAILLALLVAAVAVAVAGQRVAGLLRASAALVLPAAMLAAAVAVPLGTVLAKTNAFGRRAALAGLAGLAVLPLHVVAGGWAAAFGFRGWFTSLTPGEGVASAWLEGWRGAVAVHALAATPFVTLLVIVALRAVDRRREEQAAIEGPPRRVLARVSLREAAPAIGAVVLFAAVQASTEIAATDLFRVRTFAEEVYTQAAAGGLSMGASCGRGAVSLVAGVAAMAAACFSALAVLGRRSIAAATAGRPWVVGLGRRRALVSVGLAVAMGGLIGVPVGSLVYKAGERIVRDGDAWRREWSAAKAAMVVAEAPVRHRREIGVSATLALTVATAAVVVGGGVAWACRESVAVRRIAAPAAAIALAVPGPVVGLAVIGVLNQPLDSALAPVGALYDTLFAPWLAQTIRLAPVAGLLLWPAAATVPRSLLDAARVEGVGPVGRLVRVAAPLRWPAVAAGWIVVFALSVGELSATALVTPPGPPPLSVRLLSLLHYGVEDRVAGISLALFVAYAGAGAAALALLSRSADASARVP